MTTTIKSTRRIRRTSWFPGSINPEHPGVYRVVKGGSLGECWAHWDGRRWSHCTCRDLSPSADVFNHGPNAFPVLVWRGLTREAK